MSDPKSDQEIAAALAEIGITPAVASLLHFVHYGVVIPPHDLCQFATDDHYTLGGLVTEHETSAALTACFDRGWLQVIDESVLAGLRAEIARENRIGPIYDYPSPGGVDFTLAGADAWFRIHERLWSERGDSDFAYCEVVHEKSASYFPSQTAALEYLDSWKDYDGVVAVNGPVAVGPWRANWWRRFPQGYRIEVEQRRKWSGGVSNFTSCYFNPERLPCDLVRTIETLERHNVGWAQWLILQSLESPDIERRIVSAAVKKSRRLARPLTEIDCADALEACRLGGWLRRIDEHVAVEIQNLLSADSAIMPVPFDPEQSWGELDFSPDGAAFYRLLSAEIYGPEWEHGVRADVACYREEHRYCATEASLEGVRQEYASSGEPYASVRVVPLGPWCVYWWERFPAGYRMELLFGEL